MYKKKPTYVYNDTFTFHLVSSRNQISLFLRDSIRETQRRCSTNVCSAEKFNWPGKLLIFILLRWETLNVVVLSILMREQKLGETGGELVQDWYFK